MVLVSFCSPQRLFMANLRIFHTVPDDAYWHKKRGISACAIPERTIIISCPRIAFILSFLLHLNKLANISPTT